MQNETTPATGHTLTVHLVNSFTRDNTGGNPAGVVLNPPPLSDAQKTAIAKDVGFSETAFVCPGEETDFKVDFFTAEGEVDFCGHATLAVFFTLHSLGQITSGGYTQKTKAGILNVAAGPQGVVMDQTLPVMRQGPDAETVAAALGLPGDAITGTGLPVMVVSTGLPDIIIPVQPGRLDTMQPDFSAVTALSREFGTIGCHVFELSSEPSVTAHCRNFAPLYGIDEESATGSASGALGSYLVRYVHQNETDFLLEQGRAMNCSSLIHVTIDSQAGTINRVRVGGQATFIGTKQIHL